METETNGTENTNHNPESSKKSNTKIIVIVVAVIVGLFLLQNLFSPERAAERMLERATGGDYDVDIDRGGNVEFKGGDGEEINVSAGQNVSLPASWPSSVPILPGAKIEYAGTVGGDAGVTTVNYSIDQSAAEVVSFYKNQLTRGGWTIEADVNTGDGSMISATRGENENVTVYAGESSNGATVTISVEN